MGGVVEGAGRAAGVAPESLTRFFGRAPELTALTGLLDGARLVTLVGAPGCGKTRLAVELAVRYGDGVRFVGLASVGDAALVPGAVAAGVGVGEEPGVPIERTLSANLAAADLLLVLDNCEHLAGAAAELVGGLLAACPAVRVLATSRTPLGVPGEQLFRVPELDAGTAMELYADRAALVGPGVGAGEEADVAAICRRLDGLPLAIELAAAWSRVLSAAQIRERLESELPMQAGRNRTMAATVDWSYRLLAPDERLLFDRLSVFAGGFDLVAAERVAGAGADVLAGLAVLVDHSLVLAEPAAGGVMRYRLLEPVRQCAARMLDARGETAGLRDRHAAYFLTVARRGDAGLRGPDRPRHMAELRREEDNLLAALAWTGGRSPGRALRLSTDLAYFWERSGRVNDARTRLEALIDRGAGDRRLRASALARLGRLAWRQWDYAEARARYAESLAIMREAGDELGAARGMRNLALVVSVDGDPAAAIDLCEQGIARFRAHGDEQGRAWTLTVLGMARFVLGDWAAGKACYEEALAVSPPGSGSALTMTCRLGVAFAAALARDVAAHRRQLAAVLSDLGTVGEMFAEPDLWWASSGLAANEGRMRAALRLAGAARAASRYGSLMPEPFMAFSEDAVDRARRQVGARPADRLLEQGARLGTAELLAEALAEPDAGDRPLSAREREVAGLTGRGLSNEQIARELHISRRTVETHLEHVREKLALGSRHEVIAWAMGSGRSG